MILYRINHLPVSRFLTLADFFTALEARGGALRSHADCVLTLDFMQRESAESFLGDFVPDPDAWLIEKIVVSKRVLEAVEEVRAEQPVKVSFVTQALAEVADFPAYVLNELGLRVRAKL